jgi:uncharacterized protein YbjT (DUF2867 family)
MVLIVGASGHLGRVIAGTLLAKGESVRVMSRKSERVVAWRHAGADVVEGDLLDHESIVGACTGVRKVVAAAHSILGRGRNASVHVDFDGHRRLIDIAKASGVEHLVYLSVYGHDSAELVPFFRMKRKVEEHLTRSGLSYTILRPTAFMDFHAHMLIGKPILEKRRVALIGTGENPRNFVATQDVAQIVVMALRDSSLANETLSVGGPANLTNMEVVRLYERLSGLKARVMKVPLGIARALVPLTRPLHPGLSQVLQMSVAADTTDQRFDTRPLLARIPALELTRLEDWIARAGFVAQTPGAHPQ